ncbi:hypothetical protein F9B85_00695 [Heliorestis acidaminivorans]|uniref:Uncharacterized protein n=1 Tax=Heliorestis acidaminivorans TaxID=553427 RepID=A0A6I0EZZ8_9FIRM|nr:hypothetical protein [Heliorestis acidaminivorans]KAB2954246.1 hypothetical protein F9B85_00695 [Heliorestis acidaminivorans]
MSIETTWNNIMIRLKETSEDIATVPSNKKEPLWFNCYIENGDLYVQNSTTRTPSTKMSQRRKITKNDFETIYPYYYRWKNGEKHLTQEAKKLSMNTAYIFALIAHFE